MKVVSYNQAYKLGRRDAGWTLRRFALDRRVGLITFPQHTAFWTPLDIADDKYLIDQTPKGKHRRKAEHRASTAWDRRGEGPQAMGYAA